MKTTADVRTMALQRALQLLHSVGAKYKIVTPDGAEYGDLELAKDKKSKRLHPLGALRNYYSPFIKDMQPGDVVQVPIGEYDMPRIQSGICAYAGSTWGNGSVVTRRDTLNNAIEVLRVQ